MSYQVHSIDRVTCVRLLSMPPKGSRDRLAALNIRNIPRDTFYRLKMAAAAQHKTVRKLLMELIEGKIQELERKGILPKGK